MQTPPVASALAPVSFAGMPRGLGAWGLWPLGVGLAMLAGRRLARLVFSGGDAPDRAAAAATLAITAVVVLVRIEAGLGWLSGWLLLALLGVLSLLPGDRSRAPAGRWREPGSTWPLAAGAAALILATLAASWLPIWPWDSVGYHLPFVNFILQSGSLAGVPQDAPYLGSYPHDIDLLFLAERLLLPDDRMLDLGQIALAPAGVAALYALAMREGASRAAGLAAGALWLTLPVVFLQLPTNYVDLATGVTFLLAAYWVLAPPSRASILMLGLAAGLLLGAKPSSPPAVALLLAVVFVRSWRHGLRFELGVALLLVMALGGESYLRNIVAHGNPIWPVAFSIGPWRFPGLHSVADLLASGAAAPHTEGALPVRLFRSWTALFARPAFDMRVGGFGLVFLFLALPGALVGIARRRRWLFLVPLAASLTTADPAVARYTLAFPGLCLALAAAEVSAQPGQRRAWFYRVAALAGALQLGQAIPGLSGGDGSLLSFARLSPEARLRSLGPDGPPDALISLRRSVAPSEAIAFGLRFDLPYLLWEPAGGHRVLRVPSELNEEALGGWISRQNVRLLLAGADEAAGRWALAHPQRCRPIGPCGGSEPSCVAYSVEAP